MVAIDLGLGITLDTRGAHSWNDDECARCVSACGSCGRCADERSAPAILCDGMCREGVAPTVTLASEHLIGRLAGSIRHCSRV
jgi:hypothetical protein